MVGVVTKGDSGRALRDRGAHVGGRPGRGATVARQHVTTTNLAE